MRDESQFATLEEVRAAIEALNTADYVRLQIVAKLMSRTLVFKADWEDLAQQALKDTWKGNRRWNRSTEKTIVLHLTSLMRRLAFRWSAAYFVPLARENRGDPPMVRLKLVPMHGEVDSIAKIQSKFGNPETTAAHRETIERLFSLFEKGSIDEKFVECKMHGLSIDEIKAKYNLSETDYQTVKRRVNRKIASVGLRDFQ